MAPAARQAAAESLAAGSNGNSQYWTRQHRVLPYNSFFVYDSASGNWDEVGMWRNGCSVDAVFELPPEELGAVTIGNYERLNALLQDYQAGPNPFRGAVTFACHQPARVEISDRSGRLVRVFKLNGRPVDWDGRDNAGHALPAGIYHCRIDLGPIQLAHTILKMN
jgi:hypothetical protein